MASLSVLHILRTIKERTAISRTQLQQLTGLSWGTITNTTRDLLSRNLIREEGALATKAGRKPVRLTINPTSHCLVGVDLTPHMIRCIVLNLAGETLWYLERPFDLSEPPERVLDQAAALVLEALAQPQIQTRTCLGVGIAAQGALDVAGGTMRFAPRMTGWNNVPIRDYLQARLPAPVRLEHDPNCLAMAERWFGDASAAEDVLCIMLGDGVGMGILIHGEVFRGSQQLAGEFGHVTIDPNGPACACGDRGCIEAYCSTAALIQAVRQNTAAQSPMLREIFATREPTIPELIVAARQQDAAALAAFGRMGLMLGVGLANLIDVFNPALVVLCGPNTVASEFFLPTVDQQVRRHAWKHSTQQIIISTLGPRSTAIGACATVLQSLFDHTAGEVTEPAPLVEASSLH